MAELDGISFCTSIKTNVETSHIPFILLTAKSGLESTLEGTLSGADHYFEKPFDLQLLKVTIRNLFKQKEALREYYAKNHFVELSEMSNNQEDKKFLQELTGILDKRLSESQLEVNALATQMLMSRSKLYSKVKTLTGKSIVEFILTYRLRKAATMLLEKRLTIQEVMYEVGIESRSYFTNAFKKEFGLPPSKFARQHKGENVGE